MYFYYTANILISNVLTKNISIYFKTIAESRYNAITEIKKLRNLLPIIALLNEPSDEAKAVSAGCNGVIMKPVDTHFFYDTINNYLNME